MMTNAFYFMLKALSVFEIFNFFPCRFGYAENQLDQKAKLNFNIYDVTNWTRND